MRPAACYTPPVIDIKTAAESFRRSFGREPEAFAFAPGRVNLIGEHVDYAGGWVLPVALKRGITVAAAAGEPGKFRVHSDKYLDAGVAEYDPKGKAPAQYINFVHALALESNCPGADFAVLSDLPIERGWSSSAAFAVAVSAASLALNGGMIRPAGEELCERCRRAEKRALGVHVGLMDQYASVFGKQGHALWFDPHELQMEQVPLGLEDGRLVLIDSGQPRRLAASGYNQRLKELEQAYEELRGRLGMFNSFRDLNPLMILGELDEISPLSASRMRHIVTEHLRVRAFIHALADGNLVDLGQLLTGSHHSLSEDYMVSTPELDALCDILTATPGIYGARLVGGGFGGGALALVDADALPGRLEEALGEYRRRAKLTATADVIETGDGAVVYPDGTTGELLKEWLP